MPSPHFPAIVSTYIILQNSLAFQENCQYKNALGPPFDFFGDMALSKPNDSGKPEVYFDDLENGKRCYITLTAHENWQIVVDSPLAAFPSEEDGSRRSLT